MVGRLVQEQQIRTARQLDAQRQPRFLSAAQKAHGHTAQLLVKAQSPQNTRAARPEFQSAVPQESVVLFGIRSCQPVIRFRAAGCLRARVQRLLHLVQSCFGGKQLRECVVHMFQCALVAVSVLAILCEGALLRQDSDRASLGEVDLSRCRFCSSGQSDSVAEHPEQRGFPASVDADDAYSVALLHREGYILQHCVRAELQCQGSRGENDHGGVPFFCWGAWGGAGFSGCRICLPSACFPAPIPHPPFPSGEGGSF